MNGRSRCERGSVTAEFAVILPAVVLVIGMLVTIMAVGMRQAQLHHSAAVAVRQLARGEDPATIQATVDAMTAAPTRMTQTAADGWVSVRLTAPAPGPLGLVPAFELVADARAPNQWIIDP